MKDLFDLKNAGPMLIKNKNAPPYDDENSLFELKLDGIRCLSYIDPNGIALRNKRNKDITALYPELSDVHRQVRKRCILDGELFLMRNGKPDFYAMERRATMTNSTKIYLAAMRQPVSFVAYDILYVGNEQITGAPLTQRKEQLQQAVGEESDRLAISRFANGTGVALFQAAKR
jgi:ATP-dependent DNA ligase